jgi:tRNA nucleotidyltransferase (CCA-adding enzyme)
MPGSKIIAEMLAKVAPTESEEKAIKAEICRFLDKLNFGLRGMTAILGGSLAKGTWLSGAFDIDIFFCFDYSRYAEKSEELSVLLEKILKERFPKYITLHGSRDYFQVATGKFTYEIIPILSIEQAGQARNITDISPLHAKWVAKNSAGLSDEIRLFKAFCKAQKVYGAESYIKGLSGYVCEILVINYGSFEKTLKAISAWKPKTIVDAENHYNGKNPLSSLNRSKQESPLIIIDPVQKERNASAVLSLKVYEQLILSAKAFIKKPSKAFFTKPNVSPESIIKNAKGKETLIISAKACEGKPDVAGSKLLKAMEYIKAELSRNDFIVLDAGWQWENDALFWYYLKKQKLNPVVELYGPPAAAKKNAQRFKAKHKDVIEKAGRLYAREKRRFMTPRELAEHLIKNDCYISEKCKEARVL